jgi:hypothetical protein
MDRAGGAFHATAELASVERCSEPETRPPKAQPRHHAACQRGAVFMAEGCGSPSDATVTVHTPGSLDEAAQVSEANWPAGINGT